MTQTQEKQYKIFVLYHGKCMDGTGAHYAASKKFGDQAKYIPVFYNEPLPLIPDGSEVYILDFAYDRATLEALNARVAKLIVLDHHKTHQEDLKGLNYAYFDMNRSGAVLAWQYFFPDIDPPRTLLRVQDRDLWRWQYKDTKDVFNALDIAGDDFSVWDWAEKNFEAVKGKGAVITEYQEIKIERQVQPKNIRFTTFRGVKVAVVNNDSYISEIGARIVQDHPEVDCYLGYRINPDGKLYVSLRSRKDFDCTPLARQLGGGGHAQAAGATASMDILKELYT